MQTLISVRGNQVEQGMCLRRSGIGRILCLAVFLFVSLAPATLYADTLDELSLHITLGNTAVKRDTFFIQIVASGGVLTRSENKWQGTAGAGKVESHAFKLAYPDTAVKPIQNMHVIWADLIAHSDADTARRLLFDPASRIDTRKIVLELNAEGTRGFALTIDQLLQQKSFWIPAFDVYITIGDKPVSFADYQKQIAPYKGLRILDQVHHDPEASYEQFKQRWQDMGDPSYAHPEQRGPGHIVGVSWDSSIPKFGVDRGAGVWNDYGNPDHFHSWFEFANIAEGIVPYWKSQTLADGLPVITTVFERDQVRYEVEQFAYPLNGPPEQRVGDIPMVLLQRVRMTELTRKARIVAVTLVHERTLTSGADTEVLEENKNGNLQWSDAVRHDVLLAVNPNGATVEWTGVQESAQKAKRLDVTLSVSLAAGGTHDFYMTLPSPTIPLATQPALQRLDYEKARTTTLQFWNSYLTQGAQFNVPERAVNDLFRANLWHALRLPRRHNEKEIDLPYSNFAYDQTGTPWPINQAVYVDYMLYGLRGYNKIASEEMAAIYHNNQQASGHVDGFAHWSAYTPGMLYAVAQNYLLSDDRASFDKLLPETLKALDWSIAQLRSASTEPGPTQELVSGPLNDLTGEGYWAFNQAYLYAGIDLMGKALEKAGNPRAEECRKIAEEYRAAIERSVQKASVLAPLVEMRDHTWSIFAPSETNRPGRIYEQWYPSDVDVGPVHLLRLKALSVNGDLADAMLNDHEDNLFLHGWGIANEPVYNQQATAYLLRDDTKATIRAFYSTMAGGFSQGVYEPVEHRWRWGQYFGPPSTDGAWFELYRNMLLSEIDANTLILGQATPRAWLEDGKQIEIKNAPSWLGNVSLAIHSHAKTGTIRATFQIENSKPGKTILLRLRHPQGKSIQSVKVNGKPWFDFNVDKEWVRIVGVQPIPYAVEATY